VKKSLVIGILLAVLAGATGLAIGFAISRARRSAANSAAAATPHPVAASGKGTVIRFAKDPAPAPPFLVTDLSGKSVSTVALKGKVILINFWATWCPPCRAEIPELIALQDKYKDQLQIIGVSMDEDITPAQVNAFAVKAGMNYPIVMSGDIEKEYGGVAALPTSFIVNRDGGVVQKHIGMLQRYEIETEVRALLGMPVDATVQTFVDTGQIFLKNAELATDLPGVDFAGLTASQKTLALKRLNSETCTCGCKLTLAECRINDTSCPISTKLAAKVVQEVKSQATPTHPPAAPNSPGSSD
jgi:thiol-disulfide isomerase/thioredoxin